MDVESAGVASSYEEDDVTDSDFGELTQHSPVPSVKKSPGFAAKDIDFQDFLRFVEANSSYTLSSAVNTRAPNPRFACQAEFDEEHEDSFLALSTCSALVDLAARRADEGLDSTNSNTIGYIQPPGLPKQGMKAYQLSDSSYFSDSACETFRAAIVDAFGGT